MTVADLSRTSGRSLVGACLLLLALVAQGTWPSTQALGQEHTHPPGGPAGLVILDASIWTGVDAGPRELGRPAHMTALAVVGDSITAIGDDATIRPWIGPKTKVIQANKRRVIPGITDSHTHIINGGFQLARLSLRDVQSKQAFVQAVQSKVRELRKGEWLLGGRWSVESWAVPEPPNKAWLDPVTGETPVMLTRMDGHQAVVNSVALRLAGIDANQPRDPVGGEIERDEPRQPVDPAVDRDGSI